VARIEDQVGAIRDAVARKDDLATLAGRIEGLIHRIDLLSEQIAGTGPRLGGAESAIAQLQASSAQRTEVAGLDRQVRQLSKRLDVVDQGQSNRTAGLSTQLNAWLVSLLLIIGALVSYTLTGR